MPSAQVRQKGGIKSLILADVQKGDTLLYLENLDNWCKVMTADGYTGYIQTGLQHGWDCCNMHSRDL